MTKVPEGWQAIDVEFSPQQMRAFQRKRDGLVLSVEQGTISRRKGKYAVNTLPQNFYEDNQVIDFVGGYDTPPAAMDAAREYMKDNPR
jgi:hypothetical protein